MVELIDKVVLVTGASGGLGNFVTEAFLAAGATVIGVARSMQPSAFANRKFVAMSADLSDGKATKEMVDAAIRQFE
jgi:NADP-dependent 3-hydroxy acid dehydrogenase YdfG